MEMSWLLEIGPYHWLALAVVLIGIEMVMPTQYLLWPGLAALVTGFLSFFVDAGWVGQLAMFAVLATAFTIASHYLPKQAAGDVRALNQRTDHIVGTFAVVSEDFRYGEGAVTVGDTRWVAQSVDGSDLTAGTRVEVVAAESTLLKVKRAA